MSEHDELCPELEFGEDADRDWPSHCLCDLIDKVRADERALARVHATGTNTGDGPCCQCCYDVLHDGTSAKDWARLAREANAACVAVMDERDALRAKAQVLRDILDYRSSAVSPSE